MKNYKITIFTPTYNRRDLLIRLYNSLIKQTSKEFIWLIIDDGSTDGTNITVNKLIEEKKINIEYYYKENGGKHTAHNLAVNKCHTDYFFIVDSDDYLVDNSISILLEYIKDIDNNSCISGIIGNKYDTKGIVVGKKVPSNIRYSTGIELYEKYKIKGDTLRIYKTKILKKFLFPTIYGEKFVPENIVFDQIDNKYRMYVITDKLYICDYQNDGYSNSIASYHIKSPTSYAMSLESFSFFSKKIKSKIKWTILYQLWCTNIKCIDAYNYTRNKFIYICCKPITKIFSIMKFPRFIYKEFNNKKIAIITLYGNNNFGNKLQNYALQKTMNYMGYNAITIKCKYRYLNKFKNFKIIFGGFIKNVLNPIPYRKKVTRFKKFNSKNIRYAKGYIKTNDFKNKKLKAYDFYLYGSDQIWNPSCFGNSQLFLGYKGEKEKNVSYAASFGISEIPNNMLNNYKNGILNFKNISLREIQGQDIIKNLNKSIITEVVLDPTLLLDKIEWDKLINTSQKKINNKYILNYFLGEISIEQNMEIEKIAKKYNYKVINIMDIKNKYYVSSPSEFLYLIKNASLICTDSYHSSIFSFIYDRPFIIFKRIHVNGENMYSRIDTLIEKFNLKNRRFSGSITEENLNHDYSEAYKILEKEREKSLNFLKKALDIKE